MIQKSGDVLRGVILGLLVCYALYRIALIDSGVLVFRYAGY
jgi:hypothetical protein